MAQKCFKSIEAVVISRKERGKIAVFSYKKQIILGKNINSPECKTTVKKRKTAFYQERNLCTMKRTKKEQYPNIEKNAYEERYPNTEKNAYEEQCSNTEKSFHKVQKQTKGKREGKRTPQFFSSGGYMTVEASIVIPVFLLAMMGIALWFQVFMIEAEVQKGVTETGKYAARQVYSYMLAGEKEKAVSIISNAMIKTYWKQYVDETFLEKSCLVNGIQGVSFQNSKYEEDTDCVKIHASYKVRISIPFIGTYQLPLQATTNQKAFTGYNNSSDEYVYVAQSGTVFHTDRTCPYISLIITRVYDTQKYTSGRSGYSACEKCAKRYDGTSEFFYITKYGKKYHTSLQCSGLKRTIQKIKLEEAKGLGQCLKCQERES